MRVPKPPIVWKGAHPNNFTVGRPAGQPTEMTEHWIVGSLASAFATFSNASRGATSTYGIGSTRTTKTPWGSYCAPIWQFVDENNTPWTDGNWASNQASVTTEHEGGPNIPLTDAMYEASAWLHAWRIQNKKVGRIKGHREVSRTPTQCPGTLDIARIKRRAAEIIDWCNRQGQNAQPAWLKARTTSGIPSVVYSQKDGLFLRNLNDPSKAVDSRRWGVNQVFEIGSKTVVGGKTYYITKSSTKANAAAGLLAGEVSAAQYVAPKPPVTLVKTDKFSPAKKFVFNQNTTLVDIPSNVPSKTTGKLNYKEGETLETVAELMHFSDGKRFYRTQFSVNEKIMRGFGASKLSEYVAPAEPPKPPVDDAPEWVDDIQEEPKRPMYVLRATPLIDLENGHPYIDPKLNKEVWYQAGDVIQDVVAHVVIGERTYRMTAFSYGKTKAGEWKLFANGIDSDDLSVDPQSTPPNTPANPTDDEVKTFLQMIRDLIDKFLARFK